MEYLLTFYVYSKLETTDTKVIQVSTLVRDRRSFLINVKHVKFQLLFCSTKTILNSFHRHIPATYQHRGRQNTRLKEHKRFKGFILKMSWCHGDEIIEVSILPIINSPTRHWWRFLSFHIFPEFFIEYLYQGWSPWKAFLTF